MKISVIVPVYNVEHYLERCLDSILKQNYNEFEIILINDGSTDGSLDICKKYAKKYENIQLVNQKNQGSGYARNTGMKVARGRYYYFCDPDDYLDEHFFESVDKAIERNPELIIYSYWEESEKDGEFYNKRLIEIEENRYLNQKDFRAVFEELFSKNLLYTLWNKVYSRRFLKENNIKFTNAPMGQDTRFNLCLYPFLKSVQLIKTPYYHYVSNRTGSSTTKYRTNRVELQLEEVKLLNRTLRMMDKDGKQLTDKVKTNILLDNCSRIANANITKTEKLEEIKKVLNKKDFQPLLQKDYNSGRIALKILKNEKLELFIFLKKIQNNIRHNFFVAN